ncbi:hypothetical protein ACE1SV_01470 [Streptomyces sennicomposti]
MSIMLIVHSFAASFPPRMADRATPRTRRPYARPSPLGAGPVAPAGRDDVGPPPGRPGNPAAGGRT